MRTYSYRHHSCTVREHRFDVPLDHGKPVSDGNPTIEIFARELIRHDGENLPYLLFLQGGPGGRGPRQGNWNDGWIGEALKDFRVILLDQRGTGQSTRMDALTLSDLPDDQARADFLTYFRQDQIVRDAEYVRRALIGDTPWTTLGQSYGGFLTLTYLSLAPEGVKQSLITGGLPGLVDIDSIYRRTYEATAARNQVYFNHFPHHERLIREISAHLRDTEEFLPTGERLSPTRFRMIGMKLGTQTGTDMLHHLLEGPWVHIGGQRRLSAEFLGEVAADIAIPPMYGVLHESIYASTTAALSGQATNWSADRLAEETPGFAKNADPLDESEPYYLTGEHMMRAFFDEDPQLHPLAEVTNILATRTDWTPVYNEAALTENDVPVAAAIYYDDMFVPRDLSIDTGRLIGAKTLITSEHQHDGLRASGGTVFTHLLNMLRDS